MTSITALVDGFDGSSLDATLWSSFASSAGTFTESGSTLALANTSAGGQFSNVGISSAQSYVLADGDSCYLDLASVGVVTLGFRLVSGTVGSSGLWAGFRITPSTLKNESSVATGATQDSGSNVAGDAGAFSTTDNRTAYRFLRLRRSAGNMLFETSADAASWTQQDSVALSWLTGSPAITAVIRDSSGATFTGSVLNGINTSGALATGLPGFPTFELTNAFVMDMARRR